MAAPAATTGTYSSNSADAPPPARSPSARPSGPDRTWAPAGRSSCPCRPGCGWKSSRHSSSGNCPPPCGPVRAPRACAPPAACVPAPRPSACRTGPPQTPAKTTASRPAPSCRRPADPPALRASPGRSSLLPAKSAATPPSCRPIPCRPAAGTALPPRTCPAPAAQTRAAWLPRGKTHRESGSASRRRRPCPDPRPSRRDAATSSGLRCPSRRSGAPPGRPGSRQSPPRTHHALVAGRIVLWLSSGLLLISSLPAASGTPAVNRNTSQILPKNHAKISLGEHSDKIESNQGMPATFL